MYLSNQKYKHILKNINSIRSYDLGHAYLNIFPNTSNADTTDQCNYNSGASTMRPETAIAVEKLPDAVLQPEFRQELDKQFDVSIIINKDF